MLKHLVGMGTRWMADFQLQELRYCQHDRYPLLGHYFIHKRDLLDAQERFIDF